MNILSINGSPHKDGTSQYLVEKFMSGASKSGHNIFKFNCAFEKINPCIGCEVCERGLKKMHF